MATVLIIDDDVQVTRLLETFLKEEGHRVEIAHRAQDGMAMAFSDKPDVIMLDVMLPDATGFQVCSRLRQNQVTQSVPIIMMSGVATNETQHGFARQRGADEYIHKPFQVIEVGDLVGSYIRGDKTHQAVRPPERTHLTAPQPAPSRPGNLEQLRAFLHQALLRSKKTNTEPI
jgi:DNA-binding response OmpR family regulator